MSSGVKRRAKKSLMNYVFPPSPAQLHSLAKLTGKQAKLRRRSELQCSTDKQQQREQIDTITQPYQSHPDHPSIISSDTTGVNPAPLPPYVVLSKLPAATLEDVSLSSTSDSAESNGINSHSLGFCLNDIPLERTESALTAVNLGHSNSDASGKQPISLLGCDYEVTPISPAPSSAWLAVAAISTETATTSTPVEPSMPHRTVKTPLSDSDTSEELDSSTSCLAVNCGKRDLTTDENDYPVGQSPSALSDVSDEPRDSSSIGPFDLFYTSGGLITNRSFSVLKSTLSDECAEDEGLLATDQSNLQLESTEGIAATIDARTLIVESSDELVTKGSIEPTPPTTTTTTTATTRASEEVFDDRYEEIAQGDVVFTDECPVPPVLTQPRHNSSSSHSSGMENPPITATVEPSETAATTTKSSAAQLAHEAERSCDSRGSLQEVKLLLILDDSDESINGDAVESANDLPSFSASIKQEGFDVDVGDDDDDKDQIETIRSKFVRFAFDQGFSRASDRPELCRSASASDNRMSDDDPLINASCNAVPSFSGSASAQSNFKPNLLRKSNSAQPDYSGIKSLLLAPSRSLGSIQYANERKQSEATNAIQTTLMGNEQQHRFTVDRCGSDGCLPNLAEQQRFSGTISEPHDHRLTIINVDQSSRREDRRDFSCAVVEDSEAEAAVNALLDSQVGTGGTMVASEYDDYSRMSSAEVTERHGTTSLYTATTDTTVAAKTASPDGSPSNRLFTITSPSVGVPLKRTSPAGLTGKSLPANIEVSVVGSPFVYGAELGGSGAGGAPDERLIQKHPVGSQSPLDSCGRIDIAGVPPGQLLTVDPTPLVMTSGVPPISPLLAGGINGPSVPGDTVEADGNIRRSSVEGRGETLRPSPASSVSTASPDLPGKRRSSISCHIVQPPKKRFYYSRDGEGSHPGELSGNDSSRPVSVDNGSHQADQLDQPLKVQSVAVVAPQAPNIIATLKTFDLTGRTSVETVAYGNQQPKPLQQVGFVDRPPLKFPSDLNSLGGQPRRLPTTANSVTLSLGSNGGGHNGHLAFQQSPQKPFNSAVYDTFMTSSHPLSSSAQSARYPSVPLGPTGGTLSTTGRWPTPTAAPKGSFTPFSSPGGYANGTEGSVVSANSGGAGGGANGSANLAQQYYVIQEIRNLPQGECFQLALSAWEWLSLDGCRLPCVFRNREKYLAVHMVQMRLLAKFPPNVPTEIMRKHRMISHKMTVLEAWILNTINALHCKYEFGHQLFCPGDEIVSAADVEKFYWSVKAFNLSRMNEIYRSEIRANSELHLVLAAHISQLKNHCEAEIRAIERHQLAIENGSGHTLTPLTPAVSHQPAAPQALMPAGPDSYGRSRNSGVPGSPQIHQKSPTMTAASYIYQQQAVAGMYPHMLPPFRNFESISPPNVFQQFSAAIGVANGTESRSFPYGAAAAQSFLELTGRYPPGNSQYPNGLPPPGAGNLRLT